MIKNSPPTKPKREPTFTIHPLAKAQQLAEALNADPKDDWTYEVVQLAGNTDVANVACFDEFGNYCGCL